MKIFQFIFLSICALAEAAMFAFGILGLLAYVPDPEPNVPAAYFLGWLIRNDHVSESFREAYGPETIQSVRDQSITPVEVYAKYMDYVLSRDDIAPEILPFVDQYYRDGTREMSFNHSMRRYFFDYYKTVCSSYDVPRYYCVDFTWESFERLSKILDRRLYEFRQNFDEKAMENTGERRTFADSIALQ